MVDILEAAFPALFLHPTPDLELVGAGPHFDTHLL